MPSSTAFFASTKIRASITAAASPPRVISSSGVIYSSITCCLSISIAPTAARLLGRRLHSNRRRSSVSQMTITAHCTFPACAYSRNPCARPAGNVFRGNCTPSTVTLPLVHVLIDHRASVGGRVLLQLARHDLADNLDHRLPFLRVDLLLLKLLLAGRLLRAVCELGLSLLRLRLRFDLFRLNARLRDLLIALRLHLRGLHMRVLRLMRLLRHRLLIFLRVRVHRVLRRVFLAEQVRHLLERLVGLLRTDRKSTRLNS